MDKKEDLENDLRSLQMHEPSEGFAAKIVNIASGQLHSEPAPLRPWVRLLPKFCIIGFIGIFIVLAILIIRNFNLAFIDQNFLSALKILGFIGGAFLIFMWFDRQIKRFILSS